MECALVFLIASQVFCFESCLFFRVKNTTTTSSSLPPPSNVQKQKNELHTNRLYVLCGIKNIIGIPCRCIHACMLKCVCVDLCEKWHALLHGDSVRLPNCAQNHDFVHKMIYSGVSILMTAHLSDKIPSAFFCF